MVRAGGRITTVRVRVKVSVILCNDVAADEEEDAKADAWLVTTTWSKGALHLLYLTCSGVEADKKMREANMNIAAVLQSRLKECFDQSDPALSPSM
jgi:hypothetical protein